MVLALLLPLMTAVPSAAQAGSSAFDGDPATTERILAGDPAAAALEVSRTRFADAGAGDRQAAHAVVATTEAFADSLAGAALTTDGPLLLTGSDGLADAAAAELDRVLADGSTVYVLGGEAALSPTVADDITALGLVVVRLAGVTRVETALAVADEVRRLTPSAVVLLARSDGAEGNPTSAWADSMTGGSLAAAARIPIVVTPTAEMHPAVATWLDTVQPDRTVLLGGDAALTEAVEDAAPNAERLDGPERTATAAAIAGSDLWPASSTRRFVVLDGGRADGWAYGLSGAGIAADASAPPLMVVGNVSPSTRREVSTCGPADVDLLLVGDDSVIDDAIEQTLTTFDGQACASEFARLSPFDSCDATLGFFVEEGLERVGPYGLDGYWYDAPFLEDGPVGEPVAAPAPDEGGASDGDAPPAPAAPQEESAGDDSGDGSVEVSETNVQEVGVDEPDWVKTNGEAAYVSNGREVEVMDLTAGDAPVHVTSLAVPGEVWGHDLLLDEDVLLVLSRGDGFVYPVDGPPAETSFMPPYYYPDPTTRIARYDVSTPTAPVLLDDTVIDGDYRSARMVDGTVRLVTSSNPSGLHFVYPADGSQDAHDAALAHNRRVIEESTIDQWLPTVGEGDDARPAVDCDAVFAPPGFSGMATVLVSTIDVASSVQPTSSAAVLANAETIYASTDRLVVSSSQWGAWNDVRPEAVTTQLHSFDISDPAATTYVASGEVPGYVLNSFALSERDGYYRIATTTQPPWQGDEVAAPRTDNGVTILTEGGSELFETGRVFGLGEGERIFAVRYLGDIAAVVTFEQIDPLYLVDLTNPQAPRVTGELKIPGVSRYLHPLGEDHLLGVGQDGDDDGRLTGLQVSLFDISDRADPTRVDSLEFGPGDSPVEWDHKAFLYWSRLGRAFVPSTLYGPDYSGFRGGVQAIDVSTADNTLTLAGEVNQPTQQGGYTPAPDRTFVADGTLYTVSYRGISAHDVSSLADFGFAEFPGTQDECCMVVD